MEVYLKKNVYVAITNKMHQACHGQNNEPAPSKTAGREVDLSKDRGQKTIMNDTIMMMEEDMS